MMMISIISLNDDDDGDDYDRTIFLSTWDEGRTQALHFNLCNPGIQHTIQVQSSHGAIQPWCNPVCNPGIVQSSVHLMLGL